MTAQTLTFESVTRTFGRRVALDRLDLRVEPGTILGLVGRNGAGKTTTLRLAHGMLHPDSGRISVLGMDPAVDGRKVRTRVSLLHEESALYPWMTVDEILRFGGALHPRWDGDHAADLADRLGLERDARVESLSRGTRAKVALVLAVGGRPELLLLDDPTSGLDPLVRREVLEGVLEGIHDEGGAVIYASHLVHDVERIADRVAVLDQGRLELCESLETMKENVRRAEAVFDDGAPEGLEPPGAIDTVAEGRLLTVVARAGDEEITAALRSAGASRVQVEPIPLEEILVAYLRRGRSASPAREDGDV